MSRRPYNYTVLKYVHDVVTGEFVNVGLVFFAPRHGADAPVVLYEFKDRIQRLRPMFPNIDRTAFILSLSAIRSKAKSVTKAIQRDNMFAEGDALSLATSILARDGSSLQWSDIGTGIAKDLQKEFDRIVERMLSTYDRKTDARRDDEDVWRPVRQALNERNVAIALEPHIIRGSVDTVEFQHAWKNGKVHAYEPISFDLAEASRIKDKARRWRGNLDAAQDGASEDFRAHFIAGKPSNPNLMTAYYSALDIIRQSASSPEVYEESQIDSLVAKIEDEYLCHIRAH